MRRWKLRTRVAVAAALAMLIGVVGLEIGVQVILGHVLNQQLDHTLRQRAADVDELAETHPGALASGSLEGDPAAIGTDVLVVSRGGSPIASSRPNSSLLPAAGATVNEVLRSGKARFATLQIDGRDLRVYSQPLEGGSGQQAPGAVVVAASTDVIEDGLATARWLTLVAGVIAAAIAAAVCLLVTNRALRPLSTLNDEVMEVQRTADPSRRIATARTGDELDQLATALNAMLEALQRAREVERRFLADASHEMRTPLTALRGNAAYLARHGADADAFHDLENDMARLAQLLDRLLAVAREDAAAPPSETVSVTDMLERFAADPRVRMTADPELLVLADADALERAVVNLIENAKLYGPPSGAIALTAVRDGGEVAITVTDEGDGIPEASVDEATTRFWRGANSVGLEGAGLGLGLVRATAERHGGSLTIAGAAFTIRLPALAPVALGPGQLR